MKQAVTAIYYDDEDQEHTLTATAVFGDWEGDPTVPRGRNFLEPYLEDVFIDDEETDDPRHIEQLWESLA